MKLLSVLSLVKPQSYSSQLLGPALLGASTFLAVQDLSAQDPKEKLTPNQNLQKVNDPIKNLKDNTGSLAVILAEPFGSTHLLKTWQERQLRQISSLPQEDIAKALGELNRFYRENPINDSDIRRELMSASKAELCQIFEKSLKQVFDNNPDKQIIGAKNIAALKEVFPWGDMQRIGWILNAKENSEKFFSELIHKPALTAKNTEALIKTGLILLELSYDKEYPKQFAKGLQTQIKSLLNNKQNDEQCKLLEEAIRTLTARSYIYAPNVSMTERAQAFQPLITPYKDLVQKKSTDPKYISNALNVYVYFKGLIPTGSSVDNSVETSMRNELTTLLNVSLEAFNKLEDSKDKKDKLELKRQIFSLPTNFIYDSVDRQIDLINTLSKHCFGQNPKTFEELEYFFKSVISNEENSNQRYSQTKWPAYMVFKVIDDNPEYFKKGANLAVENLKKSKNDAERSSAVNNLSQLNSFFGYMPYFETQDIMHGVFPEHGDLRTKLHNWSKENIEKPILKGCLEFVENENVIVEIGTRERFIHNKVWQDTNNLLNTIVITRPAFSPDVVSTVKNKLENTRDPYIREMCYETLGSILTPELLRKGSHSSIQLMKHGLASEEHFESIRGMGKGLSMGLFNDTRNKRDSLFIYDFADYVRGTEIDEKDLTEVQSLMMDLVKIVNGYSDLYRKYLPNNTFKPTKEGKIAPEDLQALMRLRRNAYLLLAYSASHISSEKYRESIVQFLEKKFERYGKADKLPEVWANQAVALTELYSTFGQTLDENKKYLEKKNDFLRKILFDGYEEKHVVEGEEKIYKILSLFQRFEESLYINLKQSKGIFRERLTQEEELDLKDSKEYREMTGRLYRAKETFASTFIQASPNASVRAYLEKLNGLGYRDSQLQDALKLVLRYADKNID